MFCVDGHSDYAIQIYRESIKGNKNCLAKDHLPKLRKSRVGLEVLTVGGDFVIAETDLRGFQTTVAVIDSVKDQIEAAHQDFQLIRSCGDLAAASREEKIGFILHLEGAASLETLCPG